MNKRESAIYAWCITILAVLLLTFAAVYCTGCGEPPHENITIPENEIYELPPSQPPEEQVPNAPLAVHNRRITIANIVRQFHNTGTNTINVAKFKALKGRVSTFSNITIINRSTNYFEDSSTKDWIQIEVPIQFSYITSQGQRKYWLRIFMNFDDPGEFQTFADTETHQDVRFKITRTLEIGEPKDWVGEIQMDYSPLDHSHDNEENDNESTTDDTTSTPTDNTNDDTPHLIEGTTIRPSGGK